MKVLVAIPYKNDLHPSLYYRMVNLSILLMRSNPAFEMELAMYSNDGKEKLSGAFGGQAFARNALLDGHLKDHEYVLWVDADIVDYPADLLTRLYKPNAITAPAVYIEGGKQFYDTYGFIENGNYISHVPPYFKSRERWVKLDCVGCTYLIPASLYKDHRYAHDNPERTEHESIMRVAREQGIPILCDRETVIYHADLPRYGLHWHGH